ncbi:putative methylated-DNA-(protein)-cysteine S-methyltransferase DNA binding [Streptomyces sp. Tu6071]|nr:putative methylated-DNA-(protein)-cysteine S-methyltransferase DNA binding [Streptomyces sp. Tu6071]
MPPGFAHVDAGDVVLARGGAERGALLVVVGEGAEFVAGEEGAVGADDAPPGRLVAVEGHDAADLARADAARGLAGEAEVLVFPAFLLQPGGDVPVCHDPSGRDARGDVEHPVDVRRGRGSGVVLLAHPAHPAARVRQPGPVPRPGPARRRRPGPTRRRGGSLRRRAAGGWDGARTRLRTLPNCTLMPQGAVRPCHHRAGGDR